MTNSHLQSYSRRAGLPDFEVRHRFLTADEGGRKGPPRQRIRWDFLNQDDDPQRDGIYMIWPEFLDAAGNPLPEKGALGIPEPAGWLLLEARQAADS